jgi:hypothetical protein
VIVEGSSVGSKIGRVRLMLSKKFREIITSERERYW